MGRRNIYQGSHPSSESPTPPSPSQQNNNFVHNNNIIILTTTTTSTTSLLSENYKQQHENYNRLSSAIPFHHTHLSNSWSLCNLRSIRDMVASLSSHSGMYWLTFLESCVNIIHLISLSLSSSIFILYTITSMILLEQSRRADRFRREKIPSNIDTIVIGSGSGGSTAANLLAQSGQRVLVLEQHSVTGGCTHSFRESGCEYDTGLHYVSKAMSNPTTRPGAIMDFMSQGKQLWTPFSSQVPYDEIVFPREENMHVKEGAPNEWSYKFFDGADRTVSSLMESVDPRDVELQRRVKTYFDICHDVYVNFSSPFMRMRIDTLLTLHV